MDKEDFILFQRPFFDEQSANWTPLPASICNPANCGPTALNLTKIVPRKQAEIYSRKVENTGILSEKMREIIQNFLPNYKLEEGNVQPIENLYSSLNNELIPGNATIIFLYPKPNKNSVPHVTIMEKTMNNDIILLDGQTNQYYSEENLQNYLDNYESFHFFNGKNTNPLKREFTEIQSPFRKSSIQYTPSKKQRFFGGKYKRKTIKTRKTRKIKKTRKTRKTKKTKRK